MKEFSSRVFYGERPITTTLAYGASDDSWIQALKRTVLTNGQPLRFCEGEKLEKIIDEAPLGKKFGTVDLLIATDRKVILIEVKPWEFLKNDTENRLRKQIGNYSAVIDDIRKNEPSQIKRSRPSNIVRIVHELIGNPSNEVFLIIVTSDMECPMELSALFGNGNGTFKGGWLSYGHFHTMLAEMGYRVDGKRSHLYSSSLDDRQSSPS